MDEVLADNQAMETLQPVVEMLALDGYELTVSVSPTEIVLNIAAGPTACAECLVPAGVMRDIIVDKLNADSSGTGGREVVLHYPNEFLEKGGHDLQ